MPLILSDVCDALGLDDGERATVLGATGVQVLTETLETSIRTVPSSLPPMNDRQVKALRHVREHGRISIGAYRQICPNWSDETLRRDLVDLAEQGLLTKNGAKRGTHYVLAG
jgi:predicted HTH transcriptional regulator